MGKNATAISFTPAPKHGFQKTKAILQLAQFNPRLGPAAKFSALNAKPAPGHLLAFFQDKADSPEQIRERLTKRFEEKNPSPAKKEELARQAEEQRKLAEEQKKQAEAKAYNDKFNDFKARLDVHIQKTEFNKNYEAMVQKKEQELAGNSNALIRTEILKDIQNNPQNSPILIERARRSVLKEKDAYFWSDSQNIGEGMGCMVGAVIGAGVGAAIGGYFFHAPVAGMKIGVGVGLVVGLAAGGYIGHRYGWLNRNNGFLKNYDITINKELEDEERALTGDNSNNFGPAGL